MKTAAARLLPVLHALAGPDLPLRLRAWDGSEAGPTSAPVTLVLRRRRALRQILWHPSELGLARAYVSGDLDVDGDLYAALALPDALAERVARPELALGRRERFAMALTAARLGAVGPPPAPPPEESRLRGRRHTRRRDRAAISHHYDVGNDFYRLVLGPAMTYSCAYWPTAEMSLADAQAAKHDLVSRKLGLHPDQRLLDVGCGWGSMVIHAASRYGVRAVGVTISDAQADLARKRVAEAGLADRVEIRLQDYRDIDDGPYDAISSIGMAEHVGAAHLGLYAETLAGLLRPGGRLLNHAISQAVGAGGDPDSSFLHRYVFPDGELLPVGTTVSALEAAGLEVRDVESLREHYPLTLRQWVANLESNWDEAVRLSSLGRARVWRLYLTGTAVAFDANRVSVHQVLAVRPARDGGSGMPRTRRTVVGRRRPGVTRRRRQKYGKRGMSVGFGHQCRPLRLLVWSVPLAKRGSPPMRASSRRLFVGVGALALGVPLLASINATSNAATTSTIAFSHGVPTDEQRPGFEPDIVADNNLIAPLGRERLYSSVPFGFSTTESFLYESRDSGQTFQLAPGNLGPGKPTTCVGGGDTELQLDANGALFFSDLQGLTNLSNSVSTDHGATFLTNCAASPNTPVDRMWYAHTGTLAAKTLNLYEEYDAVASALPSTNNQLVETISHDGVTFLPLVNAHVSADCAGFGAYNCVTDNEGLPGNQIVDPGSGDIFIVHTAPGSSSTGVAPQVMVERGHLSTGTTPTVTWTHIGPINAPLCANSSCIDSSGNPEVIAAENFPVIAEDSSHHFYVTFATTHVNTAGAPTGPEQIYVVSSADGTHWGTPVKVTSSGTNTFPWIVAGDGGRVDLAWYHTNTTSYNGQYGASALLNAEWTVQFAQSLNAAGTAPTYTVRTATEHYIKHGQICTSGLGCTTGGDRSLGDFMQITIDRYGGAIISYVDDTSNNYSGGEAAGPSEIVRQIGGPSLRTATPTVSRIGPGQDVGSIPDDTGDAFYSANGSYTPASSNLDLTGAALSQDSSGNVIATIKLKTLSSLLPSPTSGGADAGWLIRWTVVTPGTLGNGHVYYAGMESTAGGAPRYFDGDMKCQITTTHCKYFTYPGDHTISGSYTSAGVITLKIPKADVGNPAAGTTFYSALGFTETSLTPLSQPSLFNVIDATQPFDYVVK